MQFFSKKNIYVAIPLILSLGLISIASAEEFACGKSATKKLGTRAEAYGSNPDTANSSCCITAYGKAPKAIADFMNTVTCEECEYEDVCQKYWRFAQKGKEGGKQNCHTWRPSYDQNAGDKDKRYLVKCKYTFRIRYGCSECLLDDF